MDSFSWKSKGKVHHGNFAASTTIEKLKSKSVPNSFCVQKTTAFRLRGKKIHKMVSGPTTAASFDTQHEDMIVSDSYYHEFEVYNNVLIGL